MLLKRQRNRYRLKQKKQLNYLLILKKVKKKNKAT